MLVLKLEGVMVKELNNMLEMKLVLFMSEVTIKLTKASKMKLV